MSVQKILLDYAEYVRLRDIEEKYETLLKNQQRGSGASVAADIQKAEEKSKLETPLAERFPSITLPESAVVGDTETQEKRGGHSHKIPWYFLGVPKTENEK